MENIIIICLSIYIVVREILYFIERRDMLDRLMSKNITEYKENVKVEPNIYQEESALENIEFHREEIENA